jgi:arylsulfatase A-like enzyme
VPAPPNVLLVVLDAARRDALSPYGADPAATPTLSALAQRGAAVQHAYATAPWTVPSHTAMFSGRLAGELGLDQAPDPHLLPAALEPVADELLASVLSDAGYRCHGYSANLWLSSGTGFDRGFDDFLDPPRMRNLPTEPGRRTSAKWIAEGIRARRDAGAAAIGAALKDSIETAVPDQPSFWFVNLVECHSPYMPPKPWNDLGPVGRAKAALDSHHHLGFESICLNGAGRDLVPAASMARMRHLYGRAISYMDAWLADVLAALSARAMLANTLVIVTADHGESFGENGLLAHGFSLGEQLLHVPLIAAGPGITGLRASNTAGAFSLASIPFVVAEAAGVAHPYLAGNGIALARAKPICEPDDQRMLDFAVKWNLNAEEITRITRGFTAATDGVAKLVVTDDGQESLYDLVGDPDERSPLAAVGAVAERLREAVGGVAREARPLVASPAGAGATGTAGGADPETIAALEQQMKLLGYM